MTAAVRGRGVALALLAAVLVVWFGIPAYLQWRLEAALRRALPAETISVGVRGRPDAVLAGHFARLTLDIRRAQVDGLPVERFTADFSSVEIDRQGLFEGGELKIRHIGAGQASLVLTEEGLQRYLEEAKGIKGARVRLADGLISVEGTVMLLQYEIRATMRGRFIVQHSREVVLQVESLSISGVALPPDIANTLVTPMNPLLTVDQLPVPLRLQAVAIEHGQLTLTAEPPS